MNPFETNNTNTLLSETKSNQADIFSTTSLDETGNIFENEEIVVETLDSDNSPTTVILVSKDNKKIKVDVNCARISQLVKTSLDNDSKATEIPIPSVNSDTLELIVKFMHHHNGTEPPIVEKPLRSKVMADVCSDKWDSQFIDAFDDSKDRQQLYNLILAANYMDVKSLLHLGCAKVASLIKGESLENIKDILGKGTSFSENKELKSN